VYILIGIKFIGYYISSFVVILLCTLLLVKDMKWWKALVISICLSALLYLLFAVLLGLPIK
ncbi:MAG: tripartite tricarboxylate transporter TctB family protein, partial [Candidatus Ornithospirochaeta sp.]